MSIAAWVLIFSPFYSYNSASAIPVAYFASEDACEKAAAKMKTVFRRYDVVYVCAATGAP